MAEKQGLMNLALEELLVLKEEKTMESMEAENLS